MRLKRVVIDTNVFISALLFGGAVDRIRSLWQNKKFIFLISKEILEEYIKVLAYPKFGLTEKEIKFVIEEELLPFVTTVNVKTRISHIKEDADDDKFLSLAIDGKADYIISGDKHLLDLKEYGSVRITSIREFFNCGWPDT
jgi:putative PIN family toxin of toxin-antitoxin system